MTNGPLRARLRQALLRLLYERGSSTGTADCVALSDLGLAHPERRPYAPTGWRSLKLVFTTLEIGPADVFVDIGSGAGRVVVQAARRPFSRVMGVELSEELTARAQQYVDEQRKSLKAPVELITADATSWQVPDEVTCIFLNNPFLGSILAAVVTNIIASMDRAPRPLHVVYLNPKEPARFLDTGRFELVKHVRRGRPGEADDFLILRANTAAS